MTQKGHRLMVIGGKPYYAGYPGLPVYSLTDYNRISKFNKKIARQLLRNKLIRLLNNFRPDLVHFIHAEEQRITQFLDLFTCPIITTPLGSDIYKYPLETVRFFDLTQHLLTNSQAIITLSEYARDYLELIFSISKEKIHSVYFGIDCQWIDQQLNNSLPSWTEDFGIQDDEFVIVVPRGCREVFSPITQFAAILDKLLNLYPQLRIVFFAHGNSNKLKEYVCDRLTQIKRQSQITLIKKPIPYSQIINLIAKSHLMLSMSYSDDMPATIVEAMYIGCLPVVSETPALLKEFSQSVLFVRNNDPLCLFSKLCHIIDNYSQLKERFAEKNHLRVKEKYNVAINMPKIEEIYRLLINSRR
jgi:glycosyltransferase involved in cell wall biosynthesis